MKIQDILIMYDYNYWATQKILAAAAKVSPEQLAAPYGALGSLRGILVHILESEYGWRVLCQTSVITFDLKETDFPTVAVIQQRWEEDQPKMREYLNGLTD